MKTLLLALGLFISGSASAAPFYYDSEYLFLSAEDGQRLEALIQDYNKRCEAVGGSIDMSVELVRSNRPQLDQLINQDHAQSISTFYEEQLKDVLDILNEFNPQDEVTATACSRSLTIKPTYIGHHGDLEQFSILYNMYLGGAHDVPSIQYMVVKPDDERLTLAEIVQDEAKLKDLLLKRLLQLEEVSSLDEYIKKDLCCLHLEDKKGAEAEALARDKLLSNADNFYFNEKGLHFVYQTYVLMPFSAGFPDLDFTYAELKGVIKDEYLNP